METFITELSSVIRNCPAASVSRTTPAPLASAFRAMSTVVTAKPPWTSAYVRSLPREQASPASEERLGRGLQPVVPDDRRVGCFDETRESRRRSLRAPEHRHRELAARVLDRNCREV